jgi:hypothetical protein
METGEEKMEMRDHSNVVECAIFLPMESGNFVCKFLGIDVTVKP